MLGLIFARWGTDLLLGFLPQGRIPLVLEIKPDLRVLGFTLGVEAIVNILHDKPYKMPKLSVGMKIADVIKSRGVEAGIQEYHRLKATQPETFDFSETELNSLGYQLLGQGERQAAVRIFDLNTKEFPTSSNTYDSLGEAYQKIGQKKQAIQAYKKAVELDPHNLNAQRMLKSLEQ